MERIIKIALAGRKYSGKDEFAELFEELGFHIFSFSDQLKRIATNLFPFMKKDYTSKEKESLVVYTNPDTGVEYTPRDIWQALDLLPEIYPPVFVESMSNEVLNLAAKKRQVLKRCVKDVRRPAELEWIKQNNFYLLYIDTDDPRSTNEKSQHKSESFQKMIRDSADRTYCNIKGQENWQQRMMVEVLEVIENAKEQW